MKQENELVPKLDLWRVATASCADNNTTTLRRDAKWNVRKWGNQGFVITSYKEEKRFSSLETLV